MTTCSAILPARFIPLTHQLLMELVNCWQRPVREIMKAEAAFLLTKKHCAALQHACWEMPFESQEEGIAYIRHVQPQFAGRLLFYSMLYKALLHEPKGSENRKNYWEGKALRLGRFVKQHRELILYLDSGESDQDRQFFSLRHQYIGRREITELLNHSPDDPIATDAVPTHLFAERSFHADVQGRLGMLTA